MWNTKQNQLWHKGCNSLQCVQCALAHLLRLIHWTSMTTYILYYHRLWSIVYGTFQCRTTKQFRQINFCLSGTWCSLYIRAVHISVCVTVWRHSPLVCHVEGEICDDSMNAAVFPVQLLSEIERERETLFSSGHQPFLSRDYFESKSKPEIYHSDLILNMT